MRFSEQFQAIFFFFFKEKTHKNLQNAKQTTFTLLEVFASIKNVAFIVYCLLDFVSLVDFCLWHVFVHLKFFLKKNNKLAWNCPDNLIILYYYFDNLIILYYCRGGSLRVYVSLYVFKGVFSYLFVFSLFTSLYHIFLNYLLDL